MKKSVIRLLTAALVVVLLLSVVSPVAASAKITNERQQAIVNTALAYYYRGYGVQYDSIPITNFGKYDGGPIRGGWAFSPEDATEDHLHYSVCSDFMLEVYCDAFGWIFMDNVLNCKTANIIALREDDPMVVYRYDPFDDAYANVTKDQARAAAMKAFQPGDVYVNMSKDGSAGHAMMFIGDYKGDGHDYVIHCWGSKYMPETGTDKVETAVKNANGGAIRIDDCADYIFGENEASYSLYRGDHKYIIVRPLNVLGSVPLTASAQARLKYPGLSIDRRADHDRFRDVEQGGDITVTLKLQNNDTKPYSVPVTQLVPQNAALKDAGGAQVDGNTLTWTVEIPAGETKTVSYVVTATGARGETVELTGGNVAGIRDNRIPVLIGGKHLTSAQCEALLKIKDYKALLRRQKLTSSGFAETVYREVLGLDVKIPTMGELRKNLFQNAKVAKVGWMYEPLKEAPESYKLESSMQIPTYFGGFTVLTEDSSGRVLTFESYHLYPGDVVLALVSGSENLGLVYLGDNKVAYLENDDLVIENADKALLRLLSYDFFIGIRPSLAYDDITVKTKQAAAVSGAMPFTDVKEADWFYPYVEELYRDGTINGMTPTTFVPGGKLTYGQALKLIVCALGYGEKASVTAHWASGYLTFARDSGWLKGSIDLDGGVSRLEFCRLAAKAKNLTAQDVANPFTDTEDASVLALVGAGVINGMTPTTFAPDEPLTRAQISKIICALRGV